MRLWYNGPAIDTGVNWYAGSRLEAKLDPVAMSELRAGFALSERAVAARTFQDVTVNNSQACPARQFTPFVSWTRMFP